jgi:nicotinate-nucleotide--dimethylbenzimidazole phosphoribosyltransferase
MKSITQEARRKLDSLTKPPGSLGRLEDLAVRLCEVQGTLSPRTKPRRCVLFAADHGVVAEGVSAWPAEVTRLMIDNIRGGGAASSVLARAHDCALDLVDVGSLHPVPEGDTNFFVQRVRAGSRNLVREPALTVSEFDAAFEIGRAHAERIAQLGTRLAVTGEMGIGNTTSAAILTAVLVDVPPEGVVGRGAGADDAVLARKRLVVENAVDAARLHSKQDRRAAIASVCGFEIAAMAGFFVGARSRSMGVILDGSIATAAALIAEEVAPGTKHGLIAAHRSVEPSHAIALSTLGLEPFLDWNLRLGEGSGALLLLPLVDAAAVILSDMATFESAGITRG